MGARHTGVFITCTVTGGNDTDFRKGECTDKQPNTPTEPLNQTKSHLNHARYNSPTKQAHVVLQEPDLHYPGSNPSQVRI